MKKQEIISFVKVNRNFNLLWASQGLSQITLNMINFVMATRIYEKTGSTLAVSFLWVFYYLPSFFLGPFSGFFVDHWSRRKTLLYTNLLQGVTMLMFLFTKGNIYPIYPIVFLYSLLNQFYCPAEAASLPSLVKKTDLPKANSLFMLTSQTALVIGLGVSGILMRLFGKNLPILISAVCLFLAAWAVSFLPTNEPEKTDWFHSFGRFWGGIKAGYTFISKTRIILFPLLLTIFFQIFLVIFGVTIPGFARDILGIEIQDAGPLIVVPLGLGTLAGVFLLTRFGQKYRKRTLMKNGMVAGLLILVFSALAIPYFGRYRTLVAMPLMMLLGLAGFVIMVPNQTLVQENTPPFLRGRVFGAWGFLTNVLTLPILLFAATIVDAVGIRPFIFLAAAGVVLLIIVFDRVEAYILSDVNNKIIKE